MDDTNIMQGRARTRCNLSTDRATPGQEKRVTRNVKSIAADVNDRRSRRQPSVGIHKLQARTINTEDSFIPITDVGLSKVNGDVLTFNNGDGMGRCSQRIIVPGHYVSTIHLDVLWGIS